MEKIINYENLRSFAYVNDAIVKHPIRGIAVRFYGLGGNGMFSEDTDEGKFFAERGIIFICPYQNPWAWMNRQNVDFTDEIIDVLFEKYSLSDDTPVISTGESMGGQSALVYCAYSKRTPAACVANCPVCDVVYHFTERPDLPRTLYSAVYNYDGTLEDALKSISPLYLGERLPKINYHIFHCDADKAVNIDSHSEKLIAYMREHDYKLNYHVISGRGHCDLDEENEKAYYDAIINEVAQAAVK